MWGGIVPAREAWGLAGVDQGQALESKGSEGPSPQGVFMGASGLLLMGLLRKAGKVVGVTSLTCPGSHSLPPVVFHRGGVLGVQLDLGPTHLLVLACDLGRTPHSSMYRGLQFAVTPKLPVPQECSLQSHQRGPCTGTLEAEAGWDSEPRASEFAGVHALK